MDIGQWTEDSVVQNWDMPRKLSDFALSSFQAVLADGEQTGLY